jgi:hypothetical protein
VEGRGERFVALGRRDDGEVDSGRGVPGVCLSESFVGCIGSRRFDDMPILRGKVRKAAADDGDDGHSRRSFFVIILAGRPNHACRPLRFCSRITRALSPVYAAVDLGDFVIMRSPSLDKCRSLVAFVAVRSCVRVYSSQWIIHVKKTFSLLQARWRSVRSSVATRTTV